MLSIDIIEKVVLKKWEVEMFIEKQIREMTIDKVNYILRYYYYFLSQEQNLILNKLHYVQDYHNLLKGVDDGKLENKVLENLDLTMSDIVCYSPDRDNYFKEKIATEIFELYSNEIIFNFCPICGELARTPIAKQAKCGHTW